MSPVLRLAHLTDLHLPLATPRGAELLSKRGLSALNWRLRRRARVDAGVAEALRDDIRAAAPDIVAVTGDLINFSLAREFEAAAAWLDGLGARDRVIALPGNHEALTPGWRRRIAPWRDWGATLGAGEGPWALRVGDVAFVAASTACATPPFLACGRMGPDARARLAALLGAARRDGLLAVALLHHPPTPIVSPRKGLLDGARVREAIAAGAALALHGHTHRAELSWIDADHGRIPVLGAPAFATRPAPGRAGGAWRLLAFERGAQGWRVTVEERAVGPDGAIAARTSLRYALPAPCGGAGSA